MLVSTHFLPLAVCDFYHAIQQNGHFQGIRFKMAIFPVSRGKNRIPQRVENRCSLISVVWALRAIILYTAELVSNYFLGYLISCVVSKHNTGTWDYLHNCFRIFYLLCNLVLHYRFGFELIM